MFLKLGIGALVAAFVLGAMTYAEGALASQSSAEPETIKLSKLIARGPDGNANVIVTDFVLCTNFVFQARTTSSKDWQQVWIPIVPVEEATSKPGERRPRLTNVKALFFSTSIENEASLEARLNQAQVQGLVMNRIKSLESKTRDLLQKSYQETNFEKCLIIHEGRTPFGSAMVYLFGLGCVLSLAASGGLFYKHWLVTHPTKKRRKKSQKAPEPEPDEEPQPSSPAPPFRIVCKCGANLRVPRERAGKVVACPKCKAKHKVPTETPRDSDEEN